MEDLQGHSLERAPLSQLSHSIDIKGVPLLQLHCTASIVKSDSEAYCAPRIFAHNSLNVRECIW